MNKVFFVDENNGFIAGGYLNDEDFQTILFKTNNSGETWEKIPELHYLINDLYFHDTQHGWALGSDKSGKNVIMETRDGGDHWAVQADNLIGSLNALSHRDNYLWAVGDYGLVLRIDLTTGVKDDKDQHLPSAFELFQNYPNPFNARTAISYQLSAFGNVELSVYNLLGQQVATLVTEKQPAGNYNVEWNASDFSSGVYFYRLITDKGFSNIKKLIVLK